jgi:hypothetical protein
VLVTVGTFAVRLAKAFGVRISGVAGTAKVDLVHALGAGRVINTSAGRPSMGTALQRHHRRQRPPDGRLASSAPKIGGRRPVGFQNAAMGSDQRFKLPPRTR